MRNELIIAAFWYPLLVGWLIAYDRTTRCFREWNVATFFFRALNIGRRSTVYFSGSAFRDRRGRSWTAVRRTLRLAAENNDEQRPESRAGSEGAREHFVNEVLKQKQGW